MAASPWPSLPVSRRGRGGGKHSSPPGERGTRCGGGRRDDRVDREPIVDHAHDRVVPRRSAFVGRRRQFFRALSWRFSSGAVSLVLVADADTALARAFARHRDTEQTRLIERFCGATLPISIRADPGVAPRPPRACYGGLSDGGSGFPARTRRVAIDYVTPAGSCCRAPTSGCGRSGSRRDAGHATAAPRRIELRLFATQQNTGDIWSGEAARAHIRGDARRGPGAS